MTSLIWRAISLFYGTEPGVYTSSVDVGNRTPCRFDLPQGNQYFFCVQAYTTAGLTSQLSYEISYAVGGESGAPTLANPGNQNSAEGEAVSLQLVAGDPDKDALSYDAVGLPPGLALDATAGIVGGTIAGDASASSPYDVTISAADGKDGFVQTSFGRTVTDANVAPALANPGDQTNAETDVVELLLAATDPDGDRLTFSASGLPPGLKVIGNSGRIHGKLRHRSAGLYIVTVSASDGSLSNSRSFRWTVVSGQ